MSILFIDFDGVTHPFPGNERDFSRVCFLWDILRLCPDVVIVFSTSWRVTHHFTRLVELVTKGGGEDLVARFIGCTPNLGKANLDKWRDVEILAWLDKSMFDGKYLIVDDSASLFRQECRELYLIDGRKALCKEDVIEICWRFNNSY